ncbi:MAG: hypothetical protein GEV10_05915 [Streptosporangiales bacterium]|nr:hypothetical protein [Streptosporangiales bacterium]
MDARTYLELVGLGSFHGLNPAMGWLFAVAIGLQERRRSAVIRSLVPVGAGHLVSIAVVSIAVLVGASAFTTRVVAIGGGVLLVGYGMWLVLSKRHFRWVGMRLNPFQLASWSFLMASVHGAGLMLLPVLLRGRDEGGLGFGTAVVDGVTAALVHTVAMVVVAAVIALVVHQFVGVRILRSAWLDLDRVWAWVLVLAGAGTVAGAFV